MAESLGGEVFALLRRPLVGAAAPLGTMVLGSLFAPGHGTVHAAPSEGRSDPAAAASDPTSPAFRFVAVWPITALPAAPTSAATPVVSPPSVAEIGTLASVLQAGPAATPASSTIATTDAIAPVPAETVASGPTANAAPVVPDDGLAAALAAAGPVPSSVSGPVDAVERFVPPVISSPVGSLLSGSSSDSAPSPAQLAVLSAALLAVSWTAQQLRASATAGAACSSPPGSPARDKPRVPTSPLTEQLTGGNQQI